MGRVTAKDVARAAAVDPSTVSRVLNRPSARHSYDAATVRRIRAAAKRLGYVPSRTAQALRTGETLLLALLVSDIGSPFFAELAACLERRVRASGYRLLVCNTDESSSLQAQHVSDLLSRGVDGLIVSPSGPKGLREAAARGLPLVTIDRRLRGLRVPHVGLDDQRAGQLLGEHLRDLGYARVGVIAPVSAYDPGIGLRADGLRRGLGRQGRIVWTVGMPHAAPPGQTAAAVCQKLQADMPQALVGLNLAANLVALEAIARSRLRVPEQLGLAGIDDLAAAPFLSAPLTVVAQPIEAIADRVVATLLALLKKQKTEPIHLLPPVLKQRASLRRLD